MVKKSKATADDHDELSVKNISKKSGDKKNTSLQGYQVYILKNSSTFKYLVQELTGNGNIASTTTTSSSCTTSPLVSSPRCAEQLPIIQNNMMYNDEVHGFQESSPGLSFDSSDHQNGIISVPVMSDPSQETIDYMPTTLLGKEYDFQTSSLDMVSFPLEYEEMGSWFSEMDALVYNNYDSYALQPFMPPEVCVFDYDLSAIM